jgi:hypothetical protein
MKERLIEFLAYLSIGQNKFEENVGLSRGFVNKIGEGITEKTLKKIVEAYPELNTNWLKTGEGEMLKSINVGHRTKGDYSPITGNIEIKTCVAELDKANIKIRYLEQIIKDKEEIIGLLKSKK